jgi:hypothetical protein
MLIFLYLETLEPSQTSAEASLLAEIESAYYDVQLKRRQQKEQDFLGGESQIAAFVFPSWELLNLSPGCISSVLFCIYASSVFDFPQHSYLRFLRST